MKIKMRLLKRRECNSLSDSCRARRNDLEPTAPPSGVIVIERRFPHFRLLKVEHLGYLKTRVQFDDARQRERGKQRTGGDRALQNSHRWRAERATTGVAPRAVWSHG